MTDNMRFTLGLTLGGSLLLLGWLALVAGQLGRPHIDNMWVEQAYSKKIQAVRRVGATPKIVVVAGSGAMFGVSSSVLSDAWGLPAINLGVNAGIGPQFMIDYALPLINTGDIVIAPLEYPLYIYDGEVNHVLLSFLLSHPGAFPGFSFSSVVKAMWAAPLKRVLEGYLGMPEGFQVAGLYGPHNLDVNGDQVNSQLALRDGALHQAAVTKDAESYGQYFTADALGWNLWRKFADALQDRGACVIFVPPPMMFKAEYADRAQERRLYRDLPTAARQNGLNYLGDPRDFLYPSSWFFDTNYHLVAEKREVYTRALVSVVGANVQKSCTQEGANDAR
jgi:signal recognition particle subunit SEC65